MLEKVTMTPAELCCYSEKTFFRFFFKFLAILSHYLMHISVTYYISILLLV
jgi:hypothetical protein